MSNSKQVNQENAKATVEAYTPDILSGLLKAKESKESEENFRKVNVTDAKGNVLFSFRVRPLSEEEYQRCQEKGTTTKRGKKIRNVSHIRSEQIIMATIDEDKHIWTSRENLDAFNTNFPRDIVEETIPAGDKMKIIDAIDELSGFGEESATVNFEEETKN